MKKTPLNAWHREAGAVMVDFGGWDMPVSYSTLSEEHRAVRTSAGLFDISHMGQVMVKGPRALEFLQKVTSNDVASLGAGRMQYSLLPAADGTLVDDIIVGRMPTDEEGYLVVVNASNTDGDLAWLKAHAAPFNGDVSIQHLDGAGMIALQGPLSQGLLQPLVSEPLDLLPYYHLCRTSVQDRPVILSRSGYTGEDGFEICCRPADAAPIWEALMHAGNALGVQPIGLGARNTLRLEMAYPLYGHEISRSVHPLEAGLGWVVKMAKADFLGKAALEKAAQSQLPRRLAGFEMVERGVARDGYRVLDGEGAVIGSVTSASPSPSLNKNIGLAYLPTPKSSLGSEIFIEVRGKGVKAVVVKTPFVPSHVRKNK